MTRRTGALAAAALLAAAAGGCGGADEATPLTAEPAPKTTVQVRNGVYRPSVVRIETGGRVTFVGASRNPVTAETDRDEEFELDREKLDRLEQFDTHTLALGEAQTVEFDTPGSYTFHSSFDGAMWGTVEVLEPR